MTDVVRYEVDHGVAWVTIDRPEARNALNAAVRTGLVDAARRFNDDSRAHVLVLTGAGDQAFCAGGDLKEMAESELTVPPPDFVPQFGRTVEVAKPTIAAVNGIAYAGGFLLALTCDLCVAAEHARFAVTEAKVGRGAPWAARLGRIVPPRIAMELLVTGDPIDARRAHELGFVNTVVAGDGLRGAAQGLAERIAANAPLSVAAAKRMVREAWDGDPDAFAAAEALWEPVYLSEDAQEGPRAFRERRTPEWKGR
jgi:enoyl-CoA hydratase/carnithine racemase